jgi:DNA-binding IscR family transcriptional regulator
MHITRHTDFALRTLIYLVAMPEEELVQVRQISQLFDLSSNHLSKVVNEPKCILLPHCRFRSILAEASDAFIKAIDKYTLDDLIEGEVQALRGL